MSTRIIVRYHSRCRKCNATIKPGQQAHYVYHLGLECDRCRYASIPLDNSVRINENGDSEKESK